MAKIRGINQKAKYAALNKRMEKYLPLVQSVYEHTARDFSALAIMAGYEGNEGAFHFSDFPELKGMVSKIMKDFRQELTTTILTGTSKEWSNSNVVQDMLADKVLKSYTHVIDREKYKQYYQPNNDAYKAFISRKEKGLTLSSRIWNQSFQMRDEMEEAISAGIEKGMSAVTLSKKVSKYLADYPLLQKDYKEKFGKATRSENCEYRSMRLARSEINMAYRTAEQTRWQEFDFVLGYEIKTSGSHPASDMCDQLQGRYPKDFVWTGWHPNCMCYEIPILMNEEQFLGEEDSEYITDTPENFDKWVDENAERIEGAMQRGTTPYFLQDNAVYVEDILELSKANKALTPLLEIPDAPIDTFIKFGYDPKEMVYTMNAFIGSREIDPFGIIQIRDELRDAIITGADQTPAMMKFNALIQDDVGVAVKSVNHWNELKSATDLSKIPEMWRGQFNEYIERMQKYDIAHFGYRGVWRDVEAAYNIYKLSTNEDAIAYGLTKLGDRYPHQIFEVFKKNGIGTEFMPNPDMFKYKGEFIPWYDGVLRAGNDRFSVYAGAYYSPRMNSVNINSLYFDKNMGRGGTCHQQAETIFYHEYGHALDDANSWKYDKGFRDFFDKFADKYNGLSEVELRELIDKAYDKYVYAYGGIDRYSEECLLDFSDTIQAIRKDHLKVSGGHDDGYYGRRREDGSMSHNLSNMYAEVLAHMNEIYWQGNPVWKYLDEDFYNEALLIIRRLLATKPY